MGRTWLQEGQGLHGADSARGPRTTPGAHGQAHQWAHKRDCAARWRSAVQRKINDIPSRNVAVAAFSYNLFMILLGAVDLILIGCDSSPSAERYWGSPEIRPSRLHVVLQGQHKVSRLSKVLVRETVPPWQEEQQMHPADSYMSQALLLNVIRMSCMYVKSHVVCCFDIISSLCVSLSL